MRFGSQVLAVGAWFVLAACGGTEQPTEVPEAGATTRATSADSANSTASDPTGSASSSSASSGSAASATTTTSAAASAGAGSLIKDGRATITRRKPAVGDKVTRVEAVDTKFTMNLTKPKVTKVEHLAVENEERVEECLAVEGDRCTKVKVTYVKFDKVQTHDNKPEKQDAPHAGKTYTVSFNGTEPVVMDASGKDAPKEEAKKVAKNFRKFLQRQDALAKLPSSVAVGDSLDSFLSDVLAATQAGKGKIEMKAKVASLKEEGGKVFVTLELTATMQPDPDEVGGSGTIEMKGTAVLRADIAAVTLIEAKGPLNITFDPKKQKGGLEGTAKGTVDGRTTFAYSF